MGTVLWSSVMNDLIANHPMDGVRYTKSVRAVERGMQPKVLQNQLGYASIKTTMDRYVHVTDDSMSKAVLQFEQNQQIQNGTVMV